MPGAYADEKVVAAVRLVLDFGPRAFEEAQRRMDEAAEHSSSDWRKWMVIRDSLINAAEARLT